MLALDQEDGQTPGQLGAPPRRAAADHHQDHQPAAGAGFSRQARLRNRCPPGAYLPHRNRPRNHPRHREIGEKTEKQALKGLDKKDQKTLAKLLSRIEANLSDAVTRRDRRRRRRRRIVGSRDEPEFPACDGLCPRFASAAGLHDKAASLTNRPDIDASQDTTRQRDAAAGNPAVIAHRHVCSPSSTPARKYLVLSGMLGAVRLLGALRRAMSCWSLVCSARLAQAVQCSASTICRRRCCAACSCSARPCSTSGAARRCSWPRRRRSTSSAPMVITALAGPLLGEWAGWRRWLAILAGFCRRAGHHTARRRRVRPRPSLCARRDAVLLLLRHHDAPHGRRRETSESLIFFSALAPVGADAADRCPSPPRCRRTAGTGSILLIARLLRRLRPLAADPAPTGWRRPRRWRPIPICRWSG